MRGTIELQAGPANLNVPYTIEGLKVVRAMVTLLESELPEEEIPKTLEGTNIPKKPLEKTQKSISPSLPPPRRRAQSKGWKPVCKGTCGVIYAEVINALLEEYKDGERPTTATFYRIILEMYGKHLKEKSLSGYASMYRTHIRENKLAESLSNGEHKKETQKKKPAVKYHPDQDGYAKFTQGNKLNVGSYKGDQPGTKDPLTIEEVAEIYNILPAEFTYRKLKSLIPVHISQTPARIDAANFAIKQFLKNTAFKCEKTSPGTFLKNGGER